MKKLVHLSLIAFATSNLAYASTAISNELVINKKETSLLSKVQETMTFNYFALYTGPSLAGGQSGASFNRFAGGRNDQGQLYDPTSAAQLFQTVRLGFKLPRNMVLSYGISFQENLTEGIEYKGLDGNTYTRDTKRSFNNDRVSLWVPGIYNGTKAALNTSLFLELPTTEASQENKMRYGIGIQPVLAIYSKIPGLFHGITASYERYVYDDYQFFGTYTPRNPDGSAWVNADGSPMVLRNMNPTRRQGMMGSVGGYVNYILTDNTTLKSSVNFDYDQRGNQVGSLTEYGNNLENIGNLGMSYRVTKGVFVEGGLTFSLERTDAEHASVFGALNIII
jgi:hypothetical protein